MTPKELVELLQTLPKEVFENEEIRVLRKDEDDEENHWLQVEEVEYNNTGQSGYEEQGEVRLFTSE